jgi:hypothetical protein
VTATFSRNVSRVSARIANVSDRLGGTTGSRQVLVVSTVELDGRINGRSVERRQAYRLPIGLDGVTYAPEAVRGRAMSGSTTERITRERTYGPLYRYGGPAATAVSIALLAGLAVGRYGGRFALSEAERAELDRRATREEFDDWITVARPPGSVLDRPRVDVASLEGLVDTAIDVDARVLEHPDGTAYYVIHDGLCYVFEPGTESDAGPGPDHDAVLLPEEGGDGEDDEVDNEN